MVHSENFALRLSEKGRRSLQRSTTDYANALSRFVPRTNPRSRMPFRASYPGQIHALGVARAPFRIISEVEILRSASNLFSEVPHSPGSIRQGFLCRKLEVRSPMYIRKP